MDIDRLINALRATNVPAELKDGREVILAPEGYTPHIQPVAPSLPERVIARRSFVDGDSLAAYVRRYANSDSLLIADIKGPRVTVALDYHPATSNRAGDSPGVGAVDHIAQWTMERSEELTAWGSFEGKLHDQETFIRFLEENVLDVISPDPAKLLDLCRDFEAIKTVNFKSSKRLQNGDREFVYAETTGTADRISVPERIVLNIPLFYGEEPLEVVLLFRYRMKEGGLQLGYEFHRLKPVLDAAFRSAAVRVAETVGLPVHFGQAF